MGDRANIIVRGDDEQVCFYNHWGGKGFFKCAQDAMTDGEDWLDDLQYFSAILFRRILKKYDPKGKVIDTLGISGKIWDNQYPVLVLHCPTKTAWFESEKGDKLDEAITFDELKSKLPPGCP